MFKNFFFIAMLTVTVATLGFVLALFAVSAAFGFLQLLILL